jgi:hypothetical protein
LIIASVDKPSEAAKAAIKESITLIKSSENAKAILENQLAIEQGEANSILAKNPEKLAEIKTKLITNRFTMPLFNTPLFTKNIEAAYKKMYARYQADLPPDHFFVS